MKGFLRRLRGVIKTGLIGAAGFGAALSGFFALTGHVDATLFALPYTAFAGFLVGGVSAGIFSLTERHRRLEDLSLRRVALWGAMGGSLVTVAFNLVTVGFVDWPAVLTITLLSAGVSSGSVALAKRADKKLIEDGDDPVPSLEGGDEPLPAIEGE